MLWLDVIWGRIDMCWDVIHVGIGNMGTAFTNMVIEIGKVLGA